jgi:hypothetical protein
LTAREQHCERERRELMASVPCHNLYEVQEIENNVEIHA